MHDTGALVIRIGFGSILYDNYSIGNYLGPYSKPKPYALRKRCRASLAGASSSSSASWCDVEAFGFGLFGVEGLGWRLVLFRL